MSSEKESVLESNKSKWYKFKWFFKELINIYSANKSFFSKKRIESGTAFMIAQWGMIFFLLKNYDKLDMVDFLMWASVEFFIAGYIINKIQKEKVELNDDKNE